jgi:hypothetical protein
VNNLSNRAYAWLMGTLMVLIILAAVTVPHWQAINQMLPAVFKVFVSLVVLVVGYLFWHHFHMRRLERKQRKEEVRLISEQIRRENEELEHRKSLETQELMNKHELDLERVTIEREKVRLEQMRATLEHQRLQAAAQMVVLPPGHTAVFPEDDYRAIASTTVRQIVGPADTPTADQPFVRPEAPAFREMAHLITDKAMPLCYSNNGPEMGTVDDLLSMAITGKPGRGKTTALMYYVAILLRSGAEVVIWDPHGAMGELAILNGRELVGMPATARVIYLDRKDDIVASVPSLQAKLQERDELYRDCQCQRRPYTKHPLLLLADELPVLSDYDDQVEAEYKLLNRRRAKEAEEPLEVPSLIKIIRRFVLEARKWRCYFIGSGQSIDAEILPTKVTDALNSRIVFFNSDRKARMSGLENDAIKTLLPLVRRAGSGCMIFDCARWDEPVIGAIPYITVGDMLAFLGVSPAPPSGTHLEQSGTWERGSMSNGFSQISYKIAAVHPMQPPQKKIETGPLEPSLADAMNEPVTPVPTATTQSPDNEPVLGPDDRRFTDEQAQEFLRRHRKQPGQAIKTILRQMNNGEGLSNRYAKYASWLLEQNGLRSSAS